MISFFVYPKHEAAAKLQFVICAKFVLNMLVLVKILSNLLSRYYNMTT